MSVNLQIIPVDSSKGSIITITQGSIILNLNALILNSNLDWNSDLDKEIIKTVSALSLSNLAGLCYKLKIDYCSDKCLKIVKDTVEKLKQINPKISIIISNNINMLEDGLKPLSNSHNIVVIPASYTISLACDFKLFELSIPDSYTILGESHSIESLLLKYSIRTCIIENRVLFMPYGSYSIIHVDINLVSVLRLRSKRINTILYGDKTLRELEIHDNSYGIIYMHKEVKGILKFLGFTDSQIKTVALQYKNLFDVIPQDLFKYLPVKSRDTDLSYHSIMGYIT